MKRIGFLFNHDAVHQVAHLAPIIVFLRQLFPDVEVHALVTSKAQEQRLLEITANTSESVFEIIRLNTPPLLQSLFRLFNNIAPLQRLYILNRYKALFEKLDCLIVPEMTSTRLKTHLGLKSTPLILLPHGAGDRAIGFSEEIKHFDYVLLSGSKVRDRMLKNGLIRRDNHCLVGYPKFDTVNTSESGRKRFFDNDKPVVLYNPHFDAHLSSWYRMGIDVLDYFSRHPQYNLIVAPHVMLYKKKVHVSLQKHALKIVRAIPDKYFHYDNIKIDTGSEASVNMSYTINSDIYLGDVSSQVYEFLMIQRPCIFLNAHNADWSDNPDYYHWHCGPVLHKVSDLSATFENIHSIQARYRNIQARRFRETFDLTATSSSVRAAQSIMSFLMNRPAAITS